jgi:hypothetical protein
MRKKIVLHKEEPELTIDNIPEYAIVAIEADKNRKYILSSRVSGPCFASGAGDWDSSNTRKDLLLQVVSDGRVTIHVFMNLKDLAKWLLE